MPRIRHIGGIGSILTAKGEKRGEGPNFVGVTLAVGAATSAMSLAMPSGWQPEDILIGAIVGSSGGTFQYVPQGWPGLGQFTISGGGGIALFCKRAKAGDTTISVAVSSSESRLGILAAYRPRGPIDLQFDQLPVPILNKAGAGGPINIASSLATRASRMIVVTGSGNYGAATVTPTPTGLTERGTTTSGTSRIYLFDGPVRKGEDMARSVTWTGGDHISTAAFLL
jgi:hypothetical protein